MIWEQVRGAIGEGNAVIAWAAPNDAGFSFETCGRIGAYRWISMAFGW